MRAVLCVSRAGVPSSVSSCSGVGILFAFISLGLWIVTRCEGLLIDSFRVIGLGFCSVRLWATGYCCFHLRGFGR